MRIAGLALLLFLAGCVDFHAGVEVTNAPHPRDCIPGSATKPCG